MAFDKLIVFLVSNIIKSSTRFNYFVDDTISKIEGKNISKDEVKQVIKQKNQYSNIIENAQNSINSLNSTTNTVKNIVNGLSSISNTIKAIPVPVAFPSAPGLPIGVIVTYADTLKSVGDQVTIFKNVIEGAKQATSLVSDVLSDTKKKLSILDGMLVIYLNNADLNEDEKKEFLDEIKKDVESIGGNSDKLINEISEESLLNKLSPNSISPYKYKDFRLEIDFDPLNKLSLPRRRIIARYINNPRNYILGDYSYTSRLSILIEEMKFKINESLNVLKN